VTAIGAHLPAVHWEAQATCPQNDATQYVARTNQDIEVLQGLSRDGGSVPLIVGGGLARCVKHCTPRAQEGQRHQRRQRAAAKPTPPHVHHR
jgi:hypothetical protein